MVLKASAYHTYRGGGPETETEQLSNKRLHPKDGRITARLFSTAVQFSVQSSETAKPDVDGYTAPKDGFELFIHDVRWTAYSRVSAKTVVKTAQMSTDVLQ